ncbi:MAG TPA: hypothetical protein PLD84_06545 [Chitinophagales bacterium]|nr:hypothetical protein [Chitinophagales bacterium]
MRLIALSIFILFFYQSSICQTTIKMPVYRNSLSLEFINAPGYVSTLFRNNFQPSFPTTALTGEFNIKNKFYAEFGLMPFGKNTHGSIMKHYENYSPANTHYAAYAGGLMKFRIANKFYFTPSVDLFFYQNRQVDENPFTYSYNFISLGLGGSAGFEYFLSNRISISTDILSMSYGLRYNTHENPYSNYQKGSYLSQHGDFGIYKTLSLGIHYNFNFKKQ